jgi:hypothetical protein
MSQAAHAFCSYILLERRKVSEILFVSPSYFYTGQWVESPVKGSKYDTYQQHVHVRQNVLTLVVVGKGIFQRILNCCFLKQGRRAAQKLFGF